jgi:hypothetical protein
VVVSREASVADDAVIGVSSDDSCDVSVTVRYVLMTPLMVEIVLRYPVFVSTEGRCVISVVSADIEFDMEELDQEGTSVMTRDPPQEKAMFRPDPGLQTMEYTSADETSLMQVEELCVCSTCCPEPGLKAYTLKLKSRSLRAALTR